MQKTSQNNVKGTLKMDTNGYMSIKITLLITSLFLSGCTGIKYQVNTVDVVTGENTLRKSGCAAVCADIMGGAWCNYFSKRAIEQCNEHKNKTEYQKELELIKRFHDQAKQGDSEAQKKLGYIYNKGLGVKKDYQESLKWYRLSAKQNNASSQYALGVMTMNGQGVSRNYEKGMHWFELSAKNGHAEAIKTIKVLKEYEKKYKRRF